MYQRVGRKITPTHCARPGAELSLRHKRTTIELGNDVDCSFYSSLAAPPPSAQALDALSSHRSFVFLPVPSSAPPLRLSFGRWLGSPRSLKSSHDINQSSKMGSRRGPISGADRVPHVALVIYAICRFALFTCNNTSCLDRKQIAA